MWESRCAIALSSLFVPVCAVHHARAARQRRGRPPSALRSAASNGYARPQARSSSARRSVGQHECCTAASKQYIPVHCAALHCGTHRRAAVGLWRVLRSRCWTGNINPDVAAALPQACRRAISLFGAVLCAPAGQATGGAALITDNPRPVVPLAGIALWSILHPPRASRLRLLASKARKRHHRRNAALCHQHSRALQRRIPRLRAWSWSPSATWASRCTSSRALRTKF